MTDSIEENYPGLLEGEVNENELKEGETYYIIDRTESTTKPREEGKYKGHKMFYKKELPYFGIRKAGTDENPREGWRHPVVYRFFKRPQDVVAQRQLTYKLTDKNIPKEVQEGIGSYLGGKKRGGKSLKKRLKKNLSKGKKKYSRKIRKGKTKKGRK